MGGKSASSGRLEQGYNMGYNAYNPQGDPNAQFKGRTDTNLAQGYLAGWNQAAQAAAYKPPAMPDFSQMFTQQYEQQQQNSVAQQQDWAAQQRAQQEEADRKMREQQAEAERQAGLSQVKSLYSSKFDAAEKATAEVNQMIADEMGHASLVGLDYNVDAATKQQRINDVFANYWGEADDTNLNELVGKWGDAGYKWDLPITRGTATKSIDKDKTPGAKAGDKVAAKGPRPVTSEDALGSAAVLG